MIHKLVNTIWKKEELLDHCKVSIILQIYKNGNEIECSNYY
jgi:hypothetical protein